MAWDRDRRGNRASATHGRAKGRQGGGPSAPDAPASRARGAVAEVLTEKSRAGGREVKARAALYKASQRSSATERRREANRRYWLKRKAARVTGARPALAGRGGE